MKPTPTEKLRSQFLTTWRRTGALLAFAVAFVAMTAPAVHAQTDYPTKPIRLVVPYPPGGQSDIVARAVAQSLTESLGKPVIVENRTGANGLLGHDYVAKAPKDGYTLLVGNSAMLAVSVTMIKDLPYDPLKDFAPIIRVGGGAYVLEVNANVPVKTVAELIKRAKDQPGKLNYGLGGFGSLPHLLGEQIKQKAGANWATVNYKGSGPMLIDLLSGQVDFAIDNLASSQEYVKAGRLRVLAVTSKTAALPGVPTLEEAGLPGIAATSWHGILAPAGTPPEILKKLNTALATSLKQPAMVQRLQALGVDAAGGTAEEFGAFIKAENIHWAAIVKQTGVTID